MNEGNKKETGVLAEGILTRLLIKLKVPKKYAGGIASAIWLATLSILGVIQCSCTANSSTSLTASPTKGWQLEYNQTAPVTGAVITVHDDK